MSAGRGTTVAQMVRALRAEARLEVRDGSAVQVVPSESGGVYLALRLPVEQDDAELTSEEARAVGLALLEAAEGVRP